MPSASLDAILRGPIEQGRIPGVAAVVTDAHGDRYANAFGTRRIGDQNSPMQVDSVAWIASMTKALTSTAAVQLIDAGLLSLDTPAKQWFEPLGQAQVLEGFDAEGQPILRAPRTDITLRHLLTHTAGYGYEFLSSDNLRFQQATGTPGVISCSNAVFSNPLLFDPGTRWNYGINIEPVGKIIETVTGKRLGEHLQSSLLGPLAMADTAFRMRPDMQSRLVSIHQRETDGHLTPLDLQIEQDPEFEMGGGGLYGTAADYAQFLRLFLNAGKVDGQALLSPRAFDWLTHNAMGNLNVLPMQSSVPALTLDVDLYPNIPRKWTLAFETNTQALPTGRSAGSLNWAGLANSYFWIDLHKGLAGVYISQVLPFLDPAVANHFADFETAVYQQLG
ncbi:beta-lactamase family protein [Lampropedia puyangensis]|uniref:Beta-lactamase family protein n=1 Tax=Lampropedia puyangensis TaxID=1330072 RepID=A0A4S8FD44_9BURK|nr:serine hydrolase domain-containing protein [Lampropedia puyangensis]THU05267.1 beta-lactamase family protein [Lampropedia puyangensis]